MREICTFWCKMKSFLLFYTIASAIAVEPEIIISPESMRVGLNNSTVILPCQIRGDNIYWLINRELYGSRNIVRFRDMGIMVSTSVPINGGFLTANVTVQLSQKTNNTEIICEAQASGYDIVQSNNATIFIANAPSPPDPLFSVINEFTIMVAWEIPFTWDDFPITQYLVEVYNDTGGEQLANTTLNSDTFSYNISRATSTSCSNVTFLVWARSTAGCSGPGNTQGAFPSRPGIFLETHKSEVTFSQNRSPIFKINFTFPPQLCYYDNAIYNITITESSTDMLVHTEGLRRRLWRDTNTFMVIELRELGLQLNTVYQANISVSTPSGQGFIVISFDTYLSTTGLSNRAMAITTTDSNNISTAIIAVASSVGFIILFVLLASFITSGIFISRRKIKRKKECNINRTRPMVENPIYEGGVIYEEISPDIKNIHHHTDCTYEKQDGSVAASAENGYSDIPCNKLEETYTIMNSVGPLLKSASNGVNIIENEENGTAENRYVIS